MIKQVEDQKGLLGFQPALSYCIVTLISCQYYDVPARINFILGLESVLVACVPGNAGGIAGSHRNPEA